MASTNGVACLPSVHAWADARAQFARRTLLRGVIRVCGGPGNGKLTWVLDMEGYSRKTSPPLSVSIATLRILQNHYPEASFSFVLTVDD